MYEAGWGGHGMYGGPFQNDGSVAVAPAYCGRFLPGAGPIVADCGPFGGGKAAGTYGGQAGSVTAVSKEYETEVHFQKCWGVMAELFEAHDDFNALIPPEGFKFLDLGCAPGGFSSFLLDDPRCKAGFGVTLPSLSGGFPVRVRRPNFFLQQGDLFEIGFNDLLASKVNVCICDAQYLRNNISWDDKYKGVRCRSKQHGVWALLCKQMWLGLSKLETGGIIIFRFGWRDPGDHCPATRWYKKMTVRLFTILHDLFDEVRDVKSDYFNALQSSFYVACTNFDREKFEFRQVGKLLGNAFNYLITTEIEDSNELEFLEAVDRIRTDETDNAINDMLDRINKLRLINEGSRRRHQQREVETKDPRAVLFIADLPIGTTDEELQSALSIFGRVMSMDRSGDSEKVSVQFALASHARQAHDTLRAGTSGLGRNIKVWLGAGHQQDSWSVEWDGQKRHQSWSTNGAVAGTVTNGNGKGNGAKGPPGFKGNADADGKGSDASKGKGKGKAKSEGKSNGQAKGKDWSDGADGGKSKKGGGKKAGAGQKGYVA
eukprot:TRINITY_DN544_c0_g1_i1.p1 TRINITY_DN544_c0_g1~~TRINITY_DN544_c0_g1_i1.p1  ORF type:complete len:544 (+),score=123.58 TRINITY_DN544_c0_g1_i1:131-1762(+)